MIDHELLKLIIGLIIGVLIGKIIYVFIALFWEDVFCFVKFILKKYILKGENKQ